MKVHPLGVEYLSVPTRSMVQLRAVEKVYRTGRVEFPALVVAPQDEDVRLPVRHGRLLLVAWSTRP